ncbi:MAG TPA: zinc dependent phospholipase C family protein [Bryobacteraceae bacterium]|nr:zinc dependent phospholipase C family protein [Bryobacteraceae bacterium]
MTRPNLCSLLLGVLALAPSARAYSVLSHEAIIDSAWDVAIKPILVQRFPHATPDELRDAHAYAYGGAIIQDMGYYPFGSHLFSDLTHYVRSGDFIVNLIVNAHDLDETAFALGSLAHYAADNAGHTIAVNRAVPMLYPKVRRKFGPVATYEDNPTAHLKTEFSFDVAEVSENHYASDAYHNFIGFKVSKPLLERAFQTTYGLPLTDVSKALDLALGTYRWTVSTLIPEMTKVAWAAKKKELQKNKGVTRRSFVYAISRSSYEKEWGKDYQRPGCWARFLSFLFRIIPKVGPFKAFGFHAPTPETQKLFMESFVRTLALYKEKLGEARRTNEPRLANDNFDTGHPAKYGSYFLADEASDKLLVKLGDKKFAGVDAALKRSLLDFYGSRIPEEPKAAAALTELRALPVR